MAIYCQTVFAVYNKDMAINFKSIRRVAGLWKRVKGDHWYLVSPRLDGEGFKNLLVYGSKTRLLVMRNRKRRKGSPDFELCAVEDFGPAVELSEKEID